MWEYGLSVSIRRGLEHSSNKKRKKKLPDVYSVLQSRSFPTDGHVVCPLNKTAILKCPRGTNIYITTMVNKWVKCGNHSQRYELSNLYVEFLTDISLVKYENLIHVTPHVDGGKF